MQRQDDLQYYVHDGPDSFRFQLAGRLSGRSARDLELAWQTASSMFGERCVIVDLSRVTSIDATGQDLLRRWHSSGPCLSATSQLAARVRTMTDHPVTILSTGMEILDGRQFRTIPIWVAAFLLFLFPASAASLKTETVTAWEDYIQTVNLRSAGTVFLWVDESRDRSAKIRAGDIVVSAAGPNVPKEVPSGLIHDWIGGVFIANTTLDQVLPVVRDYGRYKNFYQPAVIDSKPVALNDSEDRFSMLLANKSLFRKNALETDYKSTQFRVDDRRRYTISQTTRIQEVADYSAASEHTLPEGQGTGVIWRLFGVTRFEERDGGVYVEIEAIALSRDIPGALRWLVEPIIRRVAKASLAVSLQQTREAVYANSRLLSSTVAARR